MGKSIMIALDVFFLGFIISFAIALLIKILMSVIRYFYNKSAKKTDNI